MANLTITNSFTAGTTIVATQVNTNFTDVSSYINARNGGGTDWDFVSSAGLVTAKALVRSNDGTAATPAYSFTSDIDMGIFRDSASSSLRVAVGGSVLASFASTGLIVNSSQVFVPDGTAAAPSYSFNNDSDTGIFRGFANDLQIATNGATSVDCFPTGVALHAGGSSVVTVLAGEFKPTSDNAITNGTASLRWSDLRSVLINGADYGFENGYILREYPCTSEDVQTKSADWMKKNANLGIQVLNDFGKQICVIGRDGTIYANSFKSLDQLKGV